MIRLPVTVALQAQLGFASHDHGESLLKLSSLRHSGWHFHKLEEKKYFSSLRDLSY